MRNYKLEPRLDTEKNLKLLREELENGPVIYAFNHLFRFAYT